MPKIHPDKALQHKFYTLFLEWFQASGVDFWSECDAPQQLAHLANNLSFELIKPIMNVFLKSGSKEEYEAAYREYLNNTRI